MSDPNPPARYREIADHLRSLVAAAEPGSRLPSDAELCEQFGVSRMTARQAVHVLVTEGLVHRVRGRGTFVTERPVPRLLGSPLSFTESMDQRGLTATSRILDTGTIAPDRADVEALGLDRDARVGLLERLRLADGVPMAIERVVMPPSLHAVLDDDLQTGSLHQAFERLGRIPTRALAAVSARLATSRECELLEIAPGDVVLCERRTIYDQSGSPLEHTATCYAADRYSFEAVLYRNPEEP